MASKKVTLKGGQLLDTDAPVEGFVADDESGLYFVPDAVDIGEAQKAYATVTHIATETNNPLWNQITVHSDSNTTASSLYEAHVTLQGIKDDGTIHDIADEVYTSTYDGTWNTSFDLLTSSCTGDIIKRTPAAGSGAAGTIEVGIPKMYEKYEDVDIMTPWYDTAWPYRIAHPIERSGGFLRGKIGHNDEYYGMTIRVPYMANMADVSMTDIRFTANDGITELPFYVLEHTDSVRAVCVVMIPWWFMDLVPEPTQSYSGSYVHTDPNYIYCYYGNAAATDASDITLGGYGYFGDDFEDGVINPAYTVGGVVAGESSVTETNGYLELFTAATKTPTPSIIMPMDTDLTSASGSFEVIWKITYLGAVGASVASTYPWLRVSGKGAEATSYWNVRCAYIAAASTTTGYMGVSTQSPYANTMTWGWGYTDSGAAGTWQYSYELTGASTDTRYIKMRRNKRNPGYGIDNVAWYGSSDGYRWDFIGNTNYTGTVFDTTTTFDIAMYYTSTGAGDKTIRFDSVIAYPIMSGEYEIPWETNFSSPGWMARLVSLNELETDATHYRRFSATASTLTMTSTGVDNIYSTATKNPMILYASGGTTFAPRAEETIIYETTIESLSENATAGNVQEVGIGVLDNSNLAISDSDLFGIRWTTTGATRVFYRTGFTAGTSAYDGQLGTATWAQSDFPISLRIRLDHKHRNLYYDYKFKDGEWLSIANSLGAYNHFVAGALSAPFIYMRNATANSSVAKFASLKSYALGSTTHSNGYIGQSASAYDITWLDEEAYTDYPLAYSVTPDPNDTGILFTSPTPMKRNTPIQLRTKEFGGDYSNSKIMYITDDDLIDIGPEGSDKYIGMRLVFDFNMAATDEFNIDEINFIYEVI